MKTIPGTCIAPAALADRWLGGDSIAALAADFELSAEVVEAVIRQWADERTRPAVDMTPGMQPVKVWDRPMLPLGADDLEVYEDEDEAKCNGCGGVVWLKRDGTGRCPTCNRPE